MRAFTASVIKGFGRGRGLGTPTLNLNLEEVPEDLENGVHACMVLFHGTEYPGVLFKGDRPVFRDPPSCEVHVLDADIPVPPESVTVRTVAHLRGVEDYGSPEALKAQIARDIVESRDILGLP